jgi:hypothetical protein
MLLTYSANRIEGAMAHDMVDQNDALGSMKAEVMMVWKQKNVLQCPKPEL